MPVRCVHACSRKGTKHDEEKVHDCSTTKAEFLEFEFLTLAANGWLIVWQDVSRH